MKQLLPTTDEVDPALAHAVAARPAPPTRPWVLLNMIASIDGAIAVDGRSGGLGGEGDRAVFSAIRATADIVLAGAGTVRAEGYGPPRTPPARRAERVERGQRPYPRIAVISASLDLDPTAPLFVEAPEPPLVYTVAGAPPERVGRLAAVASVVETSSPEGVDPAGLLEDLYERGARTVLLEGGPTVNGSFAAAGLIDEVNLTSSPLLVGGSAPRLAAGGAAHVQAMRLAHLWTDDQSYLYARYVRSDTSTT